LSSSQSKSSCASLGAVPVEGVNFPTGSKFSDSEKDLGSVLMSTKKNIIKRSNSYNFHYFEA